MTQEQEKLIESYIRTKVRKIIEARKLDEARLIIPREGSYEGIVVGGVGPKMYISQKTEQGISGIQFSLNQMRKICDFFTNYDPQQTTSKSIPGQRPRLQGQK